MRALAADEGGLSQAEAERRLAEHGRNALKEGKKRSALGLFFAQFADLMTVILICAAVLSAVLAFITKDTAELADTGILLFVILLNAVVGFLQQYKADAAIEKLKKLSACEAKAVRDGKLVRLDAEELVAGDIVELEEGDRVPADCRVLMAEDFRCDETALTGESRPVRKTDCIVKKRALSARANAAHYGTFCVRGRARCLVTACGMDTETGKIAALLHAEKQAPSPLDKTVAKLGKVVTVTVLAVAALLFAGNLLAGRVSFLENVMPSPSRSPPFPRAWAQSSRSSSRWAFSVWRARAPSCASSRRWRAWAGAASSVPTKRERSPKTGCPSRRSAPILPRPCLRRSVFRVPCRRRSSCAACGHVTR